MPLAIQRSGWPGGLGLRLDFLHQHAAHAVGVLESGLQRALLTRRKLADVLLAQNAAGAGGVCAPGDRAVRVAGLAEVVDVAGGGVAEPASRLGLVVGRLDRRMPRGRLTPGWPGRR